MAIKLNVGDPKSGKTKQFEISEEDSPKLIGLKIGDKVKGSDIGYSGYEFEITGGSDSSGFPMRKDVSGTRRKKILLAKGVGTRHKRKGIRLRRSVAGNEIFEQTAQVNVKVTKAGKEDIFAEKEEAPAEEKNEPPKEEKKEPEKKPEKEEKDAESEEKEDGKASGEKPKDDTKDDDNAPGKKEKKSDDKESSE